MSFTFPCMPPHLESNMHLQQFASLLVCLLFSLAAASGGDECDSETEGDLRLAGPNEFEGRVEVCLEEVWRRWCASSVTEAEISVACMQLGFTDGGIAFSAPLHGSGSGQNYISDISCSGEELSITDCNHTTAQTFRDCNDLALVCRDTSCGETFENSVRPVRLFDGTSPTEGLLEICSLGYRAGVCYEDIDSHTATLLCRELGFDTNSSGIVADEARHFWTQAYNCTGSNNISQCSRASTVVRNCSNVRLHCSDPVGVLHVTSSSSIASAITIAPTTTTTDDQVSTSTSPNTESDTAANDQVVTILVVVCAVLGILLLMGITVFTIVLCIMRGKSTRQDNGISHGGVTSDDATALYETIDDTVYHEVSVSTKFKLRTTHRPADMMTYDYAYVKSPDGTTSVQISNENTVVPSSIPTTSNISYEDTIVTEKNIAYEAVSSRTYTAENVYYESIPDTVYQARP